jgi:hydroxylaminobenzene mutase
MSIAARFLFAGILLFIIGIFSGLTAQLFQNPRLAVSGHLEGVLNGMFLLIIGLVWKRLVLGAGAQRIAFLLLLFGTYANWFLTMLGAAWGTKRLTPIAGAGYEAAAWQELVMMGGLGVMIIGMLGGCMLVLWGLRKELSAAG